MLVQQCPDTGGECGLCSWYAQDHSASLDGDSHCPGGHDAIRKITESGGHSMAFLPPITVEDSEGLARDQGATTGTRIWEL